MNAGPTGFGGAPFSKALLAGVTASSLALQLSRNWHQPLPHLLLPVIRVLSFPRLGQAIFGVSLLYYFRLLERHWGSNKYSSYTCVVIASTSGIQHLAARFLGWPTVFGPTALVFANLVSFAADVPSSWQGTAFGAPISDKGLVYLASAQLLLGASRQTLLATVAGAFVGLVHRCNLFGIQQVQVPAALVRCIRSGLSRVLPGSRAQAPTLPDGPVVQEHTPQAHAPATAPALPAPDQQTLHQLLDMGFDVASATQALQLSHNNLEVALSQLI